MRKISFTIGERVAVIEDNKITYGVIKKIFPEVIPPVFVVEFEDGNVGKVDIDRIGKIPEDKDRNHEDKIQGDRDLVEKSEITITPDQFKKIGSKIVAEEVEKMGYGGGLLGLTFTIFLAKLHRALFIDEAEE